MPISNRIKEKINRLFKGERSLKFLNPLLKSFPRAEVYLVGGLVRDLALNRPSRDYDFVVRQVPEKKLETFLKKHGSVNLVGERFGVFKFAPRGAKLTIDIALPRTEHAFGTGGYRDLRTQSDRKLAIEKDLARRDFTVNALALKLPAAELIDPGRGLSDLKNKLIRAVGEPRERFQEDYSRILRALRLAVQLNFQIETLTWKTLVRLMKKINDETKIGNEKKRAVPYETIAKEFLKSLLGGPETTLDLWDKARAFKHLAPEILKMKNCPQPPEFHAEGDVWQHTKLALRQLTSPGFRKFSRALPQPFRNEPLISPHLVLGVLFHDLGKPYTLKTPEKHGVDRIRTDEHDTVGAALAVKIGSRLRLNSVPDLPCDLDKVSWLIQKHLLTVHGDPLKFTNRTIEKYFFNPQRPGGDLLKLIYCDQMASFVKGHPQLGSLPRLIERIKQLPKNLRQQNKLPPPLLNGHEIMKILKITPGPAVGILVEQLREAQLAAKVKTKREAEKYLKLCRRK